MDNSELDMDGIAIVGMSGRFPGAKNLDEFWQNLKNGVESIASLTDEQLQSSGLDASAIANSNYVNARGTLADIDLFDAAFFGFNPKEAELTDPQHRLFLECAWEAIESAGYDPDLYPGRIGAFAGTGWNSYLFNNLRSHPSLIESVGNHQALIASDKDFLTTRVSYQLNLTGPSLDIQTACSTSLVSVSLACQSLLGYQCDMALAGGVTIFTPQETGYFYEEGGILSADGRCRAFDAKAGGTVTGNGIGIVVLKRLDEALADGDCIHAVIKGTAINNDGSHKVGYTAPSIEGQAEAIAEALAFARIDPETIGYIETHGTGTALGDPIEMTALKQAFARQTQRHQFCAIGSVKTNIGHLDAAAGIAGLIKTVLALKHQQIPPSLHFETPNPQIDFANSPFYVNRALQNWDTNGTPRRAGVSSFGIGGTNAHVILEQAPPISAASESRPWQLLMLSTKTPSALEAATGNLSEYLKQHPDCNLADVAYTLQVGRKGFSQRRVILARNPQDAIEAIAARDPQRTFSTVREQFDPTVAFMFPGQGAQYVNMGAQLYRDEPIFRHWIDRCCELLQPHLGFDLREVLYPTPEGIEDAADRLKQTATTQPALFAIEYAMAQLWMAWGIRPQAAIGHSIGEYVAACLAGVFDLEDALNLVALRGRLMQQCAPGVMLSIFLSEDGLKPFLSEKIALAACNSPSACVVSGETEAIAQLETTLRSRGIECRPLQTSHAFHSAMMEDMLAPFAERVRQVRLNPPTLPLISNVTGTWMEANEATDPNYWVRHLRQTIRFSDGIGTLLEDPSRLLLEVGPGRTLSTLAKPHLSDSKIALTSLRHPKEDDDDRAVLLRTLGRLWGRGIRIDWSSFYQQERRHRLPLPTYPFERQRYWLDAVPNKPVKPSGKIANLDDWFYIPSWKRTPNISRHPEASPSRWLVFVDEFGVGTQLVEQFKAKGCEVISVSVAETFRQLDSHAYTIDPEEIKDYQTLIRLLKIQKQLPEAIAHVWGVGNSDRSHRGFYSLALLARAFAEQNMTDSIDIHVVTDRACDVTGNEEICPENATLLGACKVIPQEYSNLSCRYIDTVLSELNSNKAIARLVRELQSNSSDRAVAYRGRSRWVQIFDPISLPASSDSKVQLKPNGVYVISGARSGGAGFKIAEHLVETLKAKIVFLGNSNSPEIHNLEQSGAELLTLEIDLTDPTSVESALDRAIDRFGRIDGIINAAEVLVRDAVCAIPDTERSRCEGLFETKIKSLFALTQGLRDREVDFVILQSSLSSVLGGLGYAAYSAVHQFVDAFAIQKNRRGSTPWISVNWDAWQLQERNELPDPDTTPSISATPSEFSMSAAEGLEAFTRIVSAEVATQIVVSTGNLSARIEQWVNPQPQDNIVEGKSETSSYSRPKLSENYAAPRNDIERAIADLWQELLGVERVGIHDNFFDLGGHSLLAIRGVSKLRERFQIDLPLRNLLFESPTVAKLATVVEQKQKDSDIGSVDRVLQEIENLSPEEVEKHLTRDS